MWEYDNDKSAAHQGPEGRFGSHSGRDRHNGGVANVNLVLEGLPEDCPSRTVSVSLVAYADSDENEYISAMDVVLSWDASVLQFQGIDNTGSYPYQWLFSGFPADAGLDGLNNTWSDGNALYTALAQLGSPPAEATSEGLLVTTFKFRKLHVGTPTPVTMLASYGSYSHTVVYDGYVPGLDITGTLTPAEVLPGAGGDTNCDGVINFGDINPFVLMQSNPAAWQAQYPDCEIDVVGDINCDGEVDFRDINPFVALLTS